VRFNGGLQATRALALAAALLANCLTLAQDRSDRSPRDLVLSGRYAEALEAFRTSDTSPETAIGLVQVHLATGNHAEAEQTLLAAARRHPDSPLIQSALAQLEFDRGNHDRAARYAQAALRQDEHSIAARWVQAELARVAGRYDEAQKGYAWLVNHYNSGAAIPRVEDLHVTGLAVAQHARWTRNSAQFQRLVRDFYPGILQREPQYWPAHAEMARLFAEKYNEADALAAIHAGLAINPHAADLHAIKAQIAVDKFDLATARAEVKRALEINPQHAAARRTGADILLADVRPAEAIVELESLRKSLPNDLETLGRLAAAYAAVDGMPQGQPSARVQALVTEVEKLNPRPGDFHLAAGDALDRMRRYPRAAEQYRLAHERMPQLLWARGKLGMTLMRLGEEQEAAKLLTEAFAIDPFHVRIRNTLEVLDVLASYAALETDHFVIKFDRGKDELLARYAARYLEGEVYPQLVEQFGYRPEGKTLIEIFSRARNTSGHGWFSARMVGLPAIGTVGACAGKMIALTSPDELPKKYNWARVLRHEYVHVLNLQQTDFSIPHWFTEGLAVRSEGPVRPTTWNEILARRARQKSLYNLDTLTLGFVRPASSEDWTLAYCQAALYVDFMEAEFGGDALVRLLAAYAERKSTTDAIEEVFGLSVSDFEQRYRQFLDQHLARTALRAAAEAPSLAELERAAERQDAGPDVLVQLARAYLEREKLPDARRWALAAQKKDPRHPQAAYVLARLQLAIGDAEAAAELLGKAIREENPDGDVLALLAALRLQAGELKEARRLYEVGRRRFPADDRWLKGLARIYLHEDAPDELAAVLSELAALEPDSLPIRKKLAELAAAKKDFAALKRWATEVLHLDLRDAEAHAQLGMEARQRKDLTLAAEEYAVAVQLEPHKTAWHVALAELLAAQGKEEEAKAVLEEVRGQAADPAVKTLLEKLNRE
jgi:predicted Zn-dependent protease